MGVLVTHGRHSQHFVYDSNIGYVTVPRPDDDSIHARRIRERWHCSPMINREDDRVDPTTGQRIWPEGSGAMMYDSYLDWILNGEDTLTYEEWKAYDRPMAIHAGSNPYTL